VWAGRANYEFTYNCLTSKKWWSQMEVVLKAVSPIYSVLRLADLQQKLYSISSFLPKMMKSMAEIRGNLSDNTIQRICWIGYWKKSTQDLNILSMIHLCLQLLHLILKHYTLPSLQGNQSPNMLSHWPSRSSQAHLQRLLLQLINLLSSQNRVGYLEEQRLENRLLMAGVDSVADWWDQYGGDCSELQEVARRIVSQCMSSSGCERNWSTFALVHTKLRNRLSYDKLHKLVFVHYNLKLRIQHFVTDMQSLQEMQTNKERERDSDPCSIIIDVAMYDEGNPIMDWLCTSRSESVPTLDEYDDRRPESPSPSRFVIEELGVCEEEVAVFRKKIGGKRGKKRKEGFEDDIFSDYESEPDQQGSPVYAESGESSFDDSEGNGDGDAVHASGDASDATELREGGSGAQLVRSGQSLSVRDRQG